MDSLLSVFLHYYPNGLLLFTLIKVFGWKEENKRKHIVSVGVALLTLILLDTWKLQIFFVWNTNRFYVLAELSLIILFLGTVQLFGVIMLKGWNWYKLAVIIVWWFFNETVRSISIQIINAEAYYVESMLVLTDILLTFCSVYIMQLHLNFKVHISKRIIIILAALSIFTEFYVYHKDISVENTMFWNMIYILLNMLFIYWCLVTLIRKMEELVDKEFLQRIQALELEQSRHHYQDIRQLRHEYKNNLLTMKLLLENENYDILKTYFNEFAADYEKKLNYIQSGNNIIDVILNYEIGKARQNGIKIHAEALVPKIPGIQTTDLAALLFNGIDNAIEASCGMKNPAIAINLKMINRFLLFTVSNRVEDNVLQKNPQLFTTKEDPDFHGNGIHIIRQISQKYHGDFEISQAGDQFLLSVMLQCTELS